MVIHPVRHIVLNFLLHFSLAAVLVICLWFTFNSQAKETQEEKPKAKQVAILMVTKEFL